MYSQQQQQQQQLTEFLLYQFSPLTSRLVLCQQTCFQKTAWRRKPSPLTPTLSWQRSNTKTDREFSSSKKITLAPHISAEEYTLTCRAQRSLRPSVLFPRVLQIFPCLPFGARQVSGGCQVSGATVCDSFCIGDQSAPAALSSTSFPSFRNGIYPLMNFASSRPHPVPRALSLSQEQVETVKTPTPEPQETETRKVRLSDVRCTIWLHVCVISGYMLWLLSG